VELAGGWKNKVMQDEISFYVLDGAMVCVAVLALTVTYPGGWYKPVLVRGTEMEQEKTPRSEPEDQCGHRLDR
jgi:hypothetical protein